MGSNPIHATMFIKLLKELLPEAEYTGWRPAAFFEYNEKTGIFDTIKGYYISVNNPNEIDRVRAQEFYDKTYRYLGIKVMFDFEDSASIF